MFELFAIAVCLLFVLIVLAAIGSCVLAAAFDRKTDELAAGDLLAQRQHEKSQLIVSAMKHDREAAFAAHSGSAFGEVPRVPQEGV